MPQRIWSAEEPLFERWGDWRGEHRKPSKPKRFSNEEPNPMYSDPPGTRYEFSEPFRSQLAGLMNAMAGSPKVEEKAGHRPKKPATIKQIKYLQKLGYSEPVGSSEEASKLIGELLASKDS